MNEQTRQRLLNLEALVEAGFQAYPYQYPKTHSAKEILSSKEERPQKASGPSPWPWPVGWWP